MAYIKERGNNNYFVRVSCGTLDNGRPFQKSRLFRPSRVNLPESKVRKELDAFVKALEEECRIELESKRQLKPILGFVTDPTPEGVIDSKQAMPTKRQKRRTPTKSRRSSKWAQTWMYVLQKTVFGFARYGGA